MYEDQTAPRRDFVFTGQSKRDVPRDISHLSISCSVKKIGDGLFFRCERLIQAKLPEGLRIIGAFAFGRCTSLEDLSIPSTIDTLSEDAFCYCKSLSTVHLAKGLKVIGKRAFQSCTSLTQCSIPSTVENIGHRAFQSCTALEDIAMNTGLQLIGSHAFSECKALTAVSIPSTVWKIGAHAFAKCKSLVDVELFNGLKRIGEMAFHLCTSLFAISLPKSLESTGNAVFLACSTLLGAEFPSGINLSLENHTFTSCSALVNVFIPPSIERTETFSFSNNCIALERIISAHDFVQQLQGRFENRPIHEACYNASQTTVDDILPLAIADNEDQLFDVLGLTPFHIVATSAIQRKDLLEVLLDKYPLNVTAYKDKNGKTMMDYLLINRSPKSIPLIQMVLQRTVVESMSEWGLDSWRTNLSSIIMESTSWEGHAGIRRRSMKRIHDNSELYRRIETTTLLELSIWKMAIYSISRTIKAEDMNRTGCRILCGADVIIPHIMFFV